MTTPPDEHVELLPVRAVADRLHVSPDSVYRLIAAGRLEAANVGTAERPRIRVPLSSLRRYVDGARIVL